MLLIIYTLKIGMEMAILQTREHGWLYFNTPSVYVVYYSNLL
jgi:hypothetical protein